MDARAFSFEFFPPKTPEGKEKLRNTWRELSKLKPRFFSCTYGAGGSTREGTLDTVLEIRKSGFEAAPHISCIASTREEIAAQLARFSDACGAEIPRWMRLKLEGFYDDSASIRSFGLDVVTALCRRLLDGGAPGLHFYTLNQAALTTEICTRLKL